MRFVPDAFAKVVYQILDNPWDFLHPMASFFGHYGVHIFLFLSGYGLAKKCLMSHALTVGALYRTAFSQILKIVKLTLLGLCFYMLFYLVKDGSFPSFDVMAKYLGFLTFTENLRPGKLYYFVSVWWFLALIVQFYLVFPLLFRAMQERPTVMLGSSISLAAAALLYKPLLAVMFMYTLHRLRTCLFSRLVCTSHSGIPLIERSAGLGMILIPLTFVWEEAFHLSFVLVTLAAIAFYCRYLRGLTCSSVLKFIGAISMFVYIVHGDMRWDLINWANAEQGSALVIHGAFVGYLAAVLAVACICRTACCPIQLLWLGPARRS